MKLMIICSNSAEMTRNPAEPDMSSSDTEIIKYCLVQSNSGDKQACRMTVQCSAMYSLISLLVAPRMPVAKYVCLQRKLACVLARFGNPSDNDHFHGKGAETDLT